MSQLNSVLPPLAPSTRKTATAPATPSLPPLSPNRNINPGVADETLANNQLNRTRDASFNKWYSTLPPEERVKYAPAPGSYQMSVSSAAGSHSRVAPLTPDEIEAQQKQMAREHYVAHVAGSDPSVVEAQKTVDEATAARKNMKSLAQYRMEQGISNQANAAPALPPLDPVKQSQVTLNTARAKALADKTKLDQDKAAAELAGKAISGIGSAIKSTVGGIGAAFKGSGKAPDPFKDAQDEYAATLRSENQKYLDSKVPSTDGISPPTYTYKRQVPPIPVRNNPATWGSYAPKSDPAKEEGGKPYLQTVQTPPSTQPATPPADPRVAPGAPMTASGQAAPVAPPDPVQATPAAPTRIPMQSAGNAPAAPQAASAPIPGPVQTAPNSPQLATASPKLVVGNQPVTPPASPGGMRSGTQRRYDPQTNQWQFRGPDGVIFAVLQADPQTQGAQPSGTPANSGRTTVAKPQAKYPPNSPRPSSVK